MPSFVAGSFALAGAIAAAAPLLIHLLNRRRYRVVPWAAMDLLREALVRNRRMLQLRDLLLLALRTLCVLLFALALARPYFSATSSANDPNQPVHVVFIVDNSLSMGYQRLSGTLLEEAKTRLNEFLERLPPGSHISVLPLCGSAQAFTHDVHRTASDARDALARIEVVDREAAFSAAVDLAAEACALDPELPTKRVILIGDQQRINWPAGGIDQALKAVPDLQIVQVAPTDAPANAWIADFRIQDDIADVDVPTIFTANIRYEGPGPRKDVEVSLSIDNARVAAQTVDLEPGQSRLVRFAHQFDLPVEPGEPVFVPATIALAPDQLPADDARHLAVPVVAALPVMFVDQYGAAGEDPQKNRYGETFHLRRLMAPISSRSDSTRQLISIRHVTYDQVERQYLEDCRLVVVAGIESPAGLTPLLREYVEQGGRLLIAAGGHFDPVAWTNAAWLDGGGVLPLPLKAEAVGRLPDDSTGKIEPFFLSPESMTDDAFRIEDASREDLDDLYRTPLFFKAVAVESSEDVLAALRQGDRQRQVEAQNRREAAAKKRAVANDDATPANGSSRPAAEETRNEAAPPANGEDERGWLLWARDQEEVASDESPDAVAARQQPRILASFSNGTPFLVERRIGRGEVLFVSSGVHSSWNNLTRTNAVVILDRLLRGLLSQTLPPRNYTTQEWVVVPVDAADRRADFSLERPGGAIESLFVDARGTDRFALTLRNLTQRGNYRVFADRPRDATTSSKPEPADRPGETARRGAHTDRLWQLELAVNGPVDESELATVNESEMRERLAGAPVRWVGRGDAIGMEGAAVRGQEFWKWLMAGALACLLLELAILTFSHVSTRAVLPTADAATYASARGT
jgi:hypothetical protein